MKRDDIFRDLSARDFFAAAALAGICANPDVSKLSAEYGLSTALVRKAFAKAAYKTADIMMSERCGK